MDLDSVSLQQALRDFETANARVLDLTRSLMRSEQQRKQLADEVERLRLRLVQLEEEHSSLPTRVAEVGVNAAKRVAKLAYRRFLKG